MNPFRTPAILDSEPRARFDPMPWVRVIGHSMKRYAAGIIPLAMVFGAFPVGRIFWCRLLGFSDLLVEREINRMYNSDPSGWCVWVWALGMVIMASPVWSPRLGNKVIAALWPSAKEST